MKGVFLKSSVMSLLFMIAALVGVWPPDAVAQASSASGKAGYETISSAFGMTLGAYFDPANAYERASLKDGTPIYGFAPNPGYKAFSQYYVMITPVTNRVYGILATGTFKDPQEATVMKRDMMNLLRSKYGDLFRTSRVEGLRHAKELRQGNRYILVNKATSIEEAVDIRYYDLALRQLAQREAKALPQRPGGKASL